MLIAIGGLKGLSYSRVELSGGVNHSQRKPEILLEDPRVCVI